MNYTSSHPLTCRRFDGPIDYRGLHATLSPDRRLKLSSNVSPNTTDAVSLSNYFQHLKRCSSPSCGIPALISCCRAPRKHDIITPRSFLQYPIINDFSGSHHRYQQWMLSFPFPTQLFSLDSPFNKIIPHSSRILPAIYPPFRVTRSTPGHHDHTSHHRMNRWSQL